MPYSFTEKKRIRKSFAKRPAVQTVPFLRLRALLAQCQVVLRTPALFRVAFDPDRD